jgi:HEAT repeat protein
MVNVEQDPEPYVRVQALWTLQDIGTERALPVVEKAAVDPSPLAATTARAAAAAIRERIARPPAPTATR